MKTRIKQFIIALAIFGGAVSVPLATQPVAAIDVFSSACSSTSSSSGGASSSGSSSGSSEVCGAAKTDDATKIVRSVINTVLYVLAFIAVIMIIIGGIRYTTSNGDSGSIKSAKDTIMYAVIGLVVAIMAFAIVNFVITNVK